MVARKCYNVAPNNLTLYTGLLSELSESNLLGIKVVEDFNVIHVTRANKDTNTPYLCHTTISTSANDNVALCESGL